MPLRVSVKWLHQGQYRRFGLDIGDKEDSYATMLNRMKGLVAGFDRPLAWRDQDGDVIVIGSDMELREAVRDSKDMLLRLATIDDLGDTASVLSASVVGAEKENKDNSAAEQTPPPADDGPKVHKGIFCDGSGCESLPDNDKTPITGARFKCIACADYDLCGRCEAAGEHRQHAMLRVADPEDQSWKMMVGRHLMRAQRRGMYPPSGGPFPGGPFPVGPFRGCRPPHHEQHEYHHGHGVGLGHPHPPPPMGPFGPLAPPPPSAGFNRAEWRHARQAAKAAHDADKAARRAAKLGAQTARSAGDTCANNADQWGEWLAAIGQQVGQVLDGFGVDVDVDVERPGDGGNRTRVFVNAKEKQPQPAGDADKTEPKEKEAEPKEKEAEPTEEIVVDKAPGDSAMEATEEQPAAGTEPSAPPAAVQQTENANATGGGAEWMVVDKEGDVQVQLSQPAAAQVITSSISSSSNTATATYPPLPPAAAAASIDALVEHTVAHLKAMGFGDDNGWLTSLVTSKQGDINAVLNAMQKPANK